MKPIFIMEVVMKNLFTLLTVSLFTLPMASTVLANSSCVQNSAGNIVCAPPGGTITTNKYGEVVCGLGACVRHKSGIIMCSSKAGGSAVINNQGIAVCDGTCISASKNTCRGVR